MDRFQYMYVVIVTYMCNMYVVIVTYMCMYGKMRCVCMYVCTYVSVYVCMYDSVNK